MSEANYWLDYCRQHDIRDVSRIISMAANRRDPAGIDGYMWTFCDQSRVIANSCGVVVR